MKDRILNEVRNYYSEKVLAHGTTPRGVDWNSKESQILRFDQLTKIFRKEDVFSVLDFGAGYGALYEYLKTADHGKFKYTGYDISREMTDKGSELFGEDNLTWINELSNVKKHDYVIASGIFNVKMKNGKEDWLKYTYQTLDEINNLAEHGFSFNMLTSYSDQEYMQDYLYYAIPESIFAHCKTKYSPQVALLHDYGLFEFTILVRK